MLLAQGFFRLCSAAILYSAPEECKFQSGHGRPWFHADGLVFDDGKLLTLAPCRTLFYKTCIKKIIGLSKSVRVVFNRCFVVMRNAANR
ncbi:hypothetical protein HMPREF9554_02371 [Treponema phagedenis F0421]|nr:hypothetical protein HMPREF9554_02371 [Treponema phagedenis F0421]